MPCGDGCCKPEPIENADEKPNLEQIREKFPNLYANRPATPRPTVTVEPMTVADVIEAGAQTSPVRNEDGEVVGYTYGATESKPLPRPTVTVGPLDREDLVELGVMEAEVVEKVDPYEMPPSRVRYNTPPMMRYPSDREDLAAFARDFFDGCQAISREKNLRYAGEFDPFKNFRLGGQYGIAIRMTDKVSRLLTLTEPGCKIDGADESVEDTCRDLANYAMLLSAMRANERS